LTWLIGAKLAKRTGEFMPILAGFPPVIINALVLPVIWLLFANDTMYFANFLSILASQSAVIFIAGLPLYYGLKKAMVSLDARREGRIEEWVIDGGNIFERTIDSDVLEDGEEILAEMMGEGVKADPEEEIEAEVEDNEVIIEAVVEVVEEIPD
jgi:hypothetical protein